MFIKTLITIALAAGVALAGYVWWPAAVFAAPVFFYVVVFRLNVRRPAWGELDGIKSAGVKTLLGGGKEQWLDGDWELSSGVGGHTVKTPSDLGSLPGFASLGRVVMRRKFVIEKFSAKKRYFLQFQGVGGIVTVKVNRKVAARRRYGFIPFECEITHCLFDSAGYENEVVVTIERPKKLRAVAGMRFGPGYAAGMFRDVCLVERGRTFISDILMFPGGDGGAEFRVVVDGTVEHPVAVTFSIVDKSGARVVHSEDVMPPVDKRGHATFFVPPGAAREWSRSERTMYTLKAAIISGGVADKFEKDAGFRIGTFVAEGFIAGGRREKLVGTKRAEMFPPYGAAFPAWAMKRDVDIAAEAGINLLWSEDMPFHPHFLDHCDRLGMYAVQELYLDDFMKCAGDTDGAAAFLEELIYGSACHPSLLFWHVDCAGSVGAALREPGVAALLKQAAARGVVALSQRLADGLGVESAAGVVAESLELGGGPGAVEEIDAPRGRILVADIVGRLESGRGKTEMMKAAVDEKLLSRMFAGGVAGVVAGHMFGWGVKTGMFSISRKKKISADVVRNFVDGGGGGVAKAPMLPSMLWLRVLPGVFVAATGVIVYLQQSTRALLLYPHVFISLAMPLKLILIKAVSCCAAALSIVYFIETNPGVTLGVAGWAGYEVFALFYGRRWVRVLSVFVLYVWPQAFAFALAWALFPSSMTYLTWGAIAVCGIMDIAVAAVAVVGSGAALTVLCAAALQGVFLAHIVPPVFAVCYVAAAYLPVVAALVFLRKKSPVY